MVCSVFDLTASSLQAFSLSFKSLGYMEYNDPQNCPGVHEPHSYYCELLYLQISGCSFLSYENDTIGRFTLALGHNKDTLLSFRLCSSVLRVWAKLSGALCASEGLKEALLCAASPNGQRGGHSDPYEVCLPWPRGHQDVHCAVR